ncbi:transposase [Enterococcus sp. DIV1537a]|uniref:transposase n=1 Tax=Enterococcus sp. DIV1537a TaxID=2774733 RepID=UPI003F686963
MPFINETKCFLMPCLHKIFFTFQLLIKQLYELLKKYQKQIHHALNNSYYNGKLECLNNHIKTLKRTSNTELVKKS